MNPWAGDAPGFSRLYIFGAGGFGREVAWLARQRYGDSIDVTFVVDRPEYLCGPVNGVQVRLIGDVDASDDARFISAVGSPGLRRSTSSACASVGLRPATLIHPRVESSAFVRIGEGSVICAGSVLTANIDVGKHVQINLACTIGHDVTIGDYSTIAPGVHVSGNVEIGKDVFVGTGATIINGHRDAPIEIGDGAIIAAGACVTRSVEAGALVAGVPAIRKR